MSVPEGSAAIRTRDVHADVGRRSIETAGADGANREGILRRPRAEDGRGEPDG